MEAYGVDDNRYDMSMYRASSFLLSSYTSLSREKFLKRHRLSKHIPGANTSAGLQTESLLTSNFQQDHSYILPLSGLTKRSSAVLSRWVKQERRQFLVLKPRISSLRSVKCQPGTPVFGFPFVLCLEQDGRCRYQARAEGRKAGSFSWTLINCLLIDLKLLRSQRLQSRMLSAIRCPSDLYSVCDIEFCKRTMCTN